MNATGSQSLELTRLLYRKGDMHEARAAAEDARYDALILQDREQWIEASAIFFQCCQELEETAAAQPIISEVENFLATSPAVALQASGETLLASWLLAHNKIPAALEMIESALDKATQEQQLRTLARALAVYALALALSPETQGRALEQLGKLDTILGEISIPDVQINAQLLRAYIYSAQGLSEKALSVLWRAFEEAKFQGFNMSMTSALAQIARVYRDLNHHDQYVTYANLAILGVNRNKNPRLYRLIEQIRPAAEMNNHRIADFQIDEGSRLVKEKSKGQIDFKNQHILFEMALMFIKHPGTRYNKEDLARLIWNQTYEPDLHDNLIYVSIKRLRTLLEPDLESPCYILRDRKGYYFNPQSIVQFKNTTEAHV